MSFRFLDLPSEIRSVIYEHLFQGAAIHVCSPLGMHHVGPSPNMPTYRKLPGVLLVSQKLREESLPIFTQCIVPIFHHPTGHFQFDIPSYYLNNFTKALIATQSCELPPIAKMPQLKTLTVEIKSTSLRFNLRPIFFHYDDVLVNIAIMAAFQKTPLAAQLRAVNDFLSPDLTVLITTQFSHISPTAKPIQYFEMDLTLDYRQNKVAYRKTTLNGELFEVPPRCQLA